MNSTSVASSFSLPISPGTRVDWTLDEKWIRYSGTYDWFEGAIFGIGAENHFDVPWSVTVQYGSDVIPVISNVPEPTTTIFGSVLALGFGTLLKRKHAKIQKKKPVP